MINFVVATAGHVDHGKSTLIKALTGMEPDRWEEERRRGLTIDLGFVWSTLPSGRRVAFVDVPGHERFLGNMLAGLGPAPVVCFVVAADEGWRAQSDDHRDAVAALGIRHGLLVITRTDRAPDRVSEVVAQARSELAETGLRDAPAIAVSAVTGAGLDELRTALDAVLSRLSPAPHGDRVRLWVDRSFTIAGAGTVLTGTLAAGSIGRDDRLELLGRSSLREVTVRGLQTRGEPSDRLQPVVRAAVNLRGIAADSIHRGDALLTPGEWPTTDVIDVRRVSGVPLGALPQQLTAHVGTAAIPVRLRRFDDDHARLTIDRRLPLVLGDRLVLRDPGSRRVLGGVRVLDADPPALSRRGDGSRRRAELGRLDTAGDAGIEVARRGAVRREQLRRLGLATGACPDGVRVVGGWWVHEDTFRSWRDRLRSAVDELHDRDPLRGGLTRGEASDLLGLPDAELLDAVGDAAGLEQQHGRLRRPGSATDLGTVESAIGELEVRLGADPFAAPEADELTALGLGSRQLAAAERAGRIIRLRDGIVLLPTAPALAMRRLAGLEQPFTTSRARQQLQTTRRVAIPLLEHLDARGWTKRLDAGHREVLR
ncbi:selenocysteine-specific translation elongation factor [Microlunatus soli]|uniref:Selenocysteine-specific elongation factor n=1 Tax=Microlunatus soli TaxID=630515 RepID=A0A1H2AGW4_9ACTN|nr:selenocysteine-specific translation elongation factor [Microlunatus soli]SDT45154.1 selenocysteine-specific elongation factor [Microlunatus soli]